MAGIYDAMQAQMTGAVCGHCGNMHVGTCWRVKAIEYHPNGTIKRVEYHPLQAAAVDPRTTTFAGLPEKYQAK
jgi:hypothetical protein